MAKSTPAQAVSPISIRREIGSTVYHVDIHFSNTSSETVGDKIVRLLRNDTYVPRGTSRNTMEVLYETDEDNGFI